MKSTILALTVILVGTIAHADGFLCMSDDGLNVKVFNHTSANEGTRSVAKLIVSDENVGYGNKTIATFSAAHSLVASYKQTYVANVDLRFKDSSRKGELIGGTKLGELAQIVLSVDFSYANPLSNDDTVNGTLTLIKRDGEELIEAMNCKRYLKN